jgi:alanine racemase
VLAWKTQVTSLRTVPAGEAVGYGRAFVAERETRLALLPVGYADGYNRLLSNRGFVLVRGQRASIAGRVSMDQTVVDVTEIPGVAIGDEVVLLGSQGECSIDAWDLADLAETIPWDVLCAISSRVPRVIVD